MDDWSSSNKLIQRLDFSRCGEDSELEEDISLRVEDMKHVTPQKNCEFQNWRTNSPFPVTPQRQLNDCSPARPSSWVNPIRGCRESLRKKTVPLEDYPGTPLHYVTWQKLQLCDTPNTPKVR